jgi:hypothetical protein
MRLTIFCSCTEKPKRWVMRSLSSASTAGRIRRDFFFAAIRLGAAVLLGDILARKP